MGLTPADVQNWHLDKLTAAKGGVDEFVQGIDTVLQSLVTDSGAVAGWAGNARDAANQRVGTEKTNASKVGDAISQVGAAISKAAESLQGPRDHVLQVIATIGTHADFTLDPATGKVTVNQAKIDEIMQTGGRAEEVVLRMKAEAHQLEIDLGTAVNEAETAAEAAKQSVADAVAKVGEAKNGLGDPAAAATAAAGVTGTPHATPVAHSSNGSSGGSGGSGGGGVASQGVWAPGGSGHGGSGGGGGGGGGGLGPSGGPPTGPMPSGEKGEWIKQAMELLKAQGVDISQIDPRDIEAIIDHESGGDPHAINLWDSNAAAGHPSKGLMQCIDSTFDAYKVPGHDDIWNPVDNIAAAVNYSIDRYGGVSNVPGIEAVRSGGGYVGY